VFLINLNPSRGGGIRKTRPCVVVSPDELNAHLRTFIVAPLDDGGPWVPVSHPVQVRRAWRARGSRPDSHRGSRAAREAAWETGPADAAANAVRPPGDVRALSGPPGERLVPCRRAARRVCMDTANAGC